MPTPRRYHAIAAALIVSSAADPLHATDIRDGEVRIVDAAWVDTLTRIGYESDGRLIIGPNGNVTTDYLHIGVSGAAGELLIRPGGRLTIGPSIYSNINFGGSFDTPLSGSFEGQALVSIEGPGALLTVDAGNLKSVEIGAAGGSGVVRVSAGGRFVSTSTSYEFGGIYIGGRNAASLRPSGRVVVTDPGSEMWSGGRIIVGAYGAGSLDVMNGGTTRAESSINIGNDAATLAFDNRLLVSGERSLVSAGTFVTVGLLGRGTAVVADGASLTSPEIRVADRAGSIGELAVGARRGDAAQRAGILDTGSIRFGAGTGALTLNHTDRNFVLTPNLSGAGTVDALSGVTKLSGDNASFTGRYTISAPAGLIASRPENIGANDIALDGGTLSIDTLQDWRFSNKLSGSGQLQVNTNNNTFEFASSALATDFTGTLSLDATRFTLGGVNTAAVKNIDLILRPGGVMTIGSGEQHIAGLKLEGGTLDMGGISAGRRIADNAIRTSGRLDISGAGKVQVDLGGSGMTAPPPNDALPLLMQDEHNILAQLVVADGAVIGDGANLQLVDASGNPIRDGVPRPIIQDGIVAAQGTWDYRLTSGIENDGLYLNHGLSLVNLLASGNNALTLNASGQTGSAADLSAKVTGTGDLAIDTGAGETVSLSNRNNDYTGRTFVNSGALAMRSDNTLGKTSELVLAAGTALRMNGHAQSIGALTTAAGSTVSLAGGALSVDNGGRVDGNLQGAGALNLNGGTLDIRGKNADLAVTTTIAGDAIVLLDDTMGLGTGPVRNSGLLTFAGATGDWTNNVSGSGRVQLVEGSAITARGDNQSFNGNFAIAPGTELTALRKETLGTGSVSNAGTLNLVTNSSWDLNNAIDGSGSLTKAGSGIVNLGASAARYLGSTAVTAGGLQLGRTGTDVTLASRQITVAPGATFGGFGGTAGSVDNAGTLRLGALAPASGAGQSDGAGRTARAPQAPRGRALATPQTFTIGGDLVNTGNIVVGQNGGAAGNALIVGGNYIGNGGRLVFNTALGGDASPTDRMVVRGATSGTTSVSVNNAGGTGSDTLNGIELIRVGGQSAGEFTKNGRIVAGAYDYELVRGQGANAANWYLTNTLDNGGGPGSGNDNGGPGNDENDPTPVKAYRPEAGAYASNLAAANNLFVLRMHDRLGASRYIDATTGAEKPTSLWMRTAGGHERATDSSDQLATRADRYVLQVGGDIAEWRAGTADQFRIGVLAGHASQHSRSKNRLNAESATGSVSGYSVGVYGNWLQDEAEKTGAYVDTWAQYSWFNNTVRGKDLPSERYRSKGISASVESGYTWALGGRGDRERYFLQPKAQVVWMGIDADDFNEKNGTRVDSLGAGNVQTRLGVRAFMRHLGNVENGRQQTFEPYIEANWIHNTRNFGNRLNGEEVLQTGARNVGELQVGAEGQINRRLTLWGSAGHQRGSSSYSATGVMAGIKMNF